LGAAYSGQSLGEEQKKILTCLQLRAMLRHLLLPAVTAFSRHFLKICGFSPYALFIISVSLSSPFG
jgi:hypothetical protein